MSVEDRDRLARTGSMDFADAGRRLTAARMAVGLRQVDLCERTGIKPNSLNNMERGRQFLNRDVMQYMFRSHRIDFNFLIYGDYSAMPPAVQDRLFAALRSLDNEPGHRSN